MKKLLPVLLLFFSIYIAAQDRELPRGFSDEELAMLEWYDWTSPTSFEKGNGTPPPTPVRHMAEWEELEALVVTWRSYKNILTQIIKYAKEEVKVVVVVAPTGSNTQANAEMILSNNGVSLDNIEFVEANSNSVWSRDYLQNTVYSNGTEDRNFVDWVYNRPRPQDDVMAEVIGIHFNTPVYSTTEAPYRLVNTGGNFMSDGLGTAFCSKLVMDENKPGNMFNAGPHDEIAIDSIHQLFMGINRYIKMEVLDYDVIHHIDMHMHLIDEETILFGQYPQGISDGPQIEANIQYLLDNFPSVFGTPYKIERIVQPPDFGGVYPNTTGDYRTYTNSVFINKTIIIPQYEEQYDTIAQRIYEEHFPGYKVVGINCNDMIGALGALHCITKEVGVSDPLLIVHQRQKDIDDNSLWSDYQQTATIQHRTGISNANLYWTTDTTENYEPIDMLLINATTDTWSANIPHLPNGTEIFYYIEGIANSGKMQMRPLAAPSGHFRFTVNEEINASHEHFPLVMGDIYPNPASAITVVPINTNRMMAAKVELIDVMGKMQSVLFDGTLLVGASNVFFDAKDFVAGTYFIRLRAEDETYTRKVVIK